MMKMDASINNFDKKKDKWQTKINQLERALEKKMASSHEEKARRRHQLTEEESRCRKLEEEIHDLNKWIFELDNERKAAEAATKIATTKFYPAKEESYGRLQKLRKETQSRRAKEDELTSTSKALCHSEKELEIMKSLLKTPQETKRRMKKEWDDIDADGHSTLKGGSRRWPTWVVLMICELLINGTQPLAVPSCIHTVYETLYMEEPDELPSVNFVRECRVFVEVMGETLTAIKLANAPEWSQLWTDVTTRRQIPFTA
jgi:hypothetical protein